MPDHDDRSGDPMTPPSPSPHRNESADALRKMRKIYVVVIVVAILATWLLIFLWYTKYDPAYHEVTLDDAGYVVPKKLYPNPGDHIVVSGTDQALLFCITPESIVGGTSFEIAPNQDLVLDVGLFTAHEDFRYGLYLKSEYPACPPWQSDFPPYEGGYQLHSLDIGAKGEGGGRTGP